MPRSPLEPAGREAGLLPAARTPVVPLDDALVVDVLSCLAAAHGELGVASCVLPALLELPGARAGCVVLRDGDDALVLGSAGYDCDSMAVGTRLPLSAGLPVTEAVRTGRRVVQGDGPSWVAVPLRAGRRRGALLLSLTGPPPDGLPRLERVARALGDALARSDVPAAAPPGGWEVAVRVLPWDGPAGGDVVLALPDGRGGSWLLAADVCGSGAAAALVARTVELTLTALAPHLDGPAALLAAADGALRSVVGEGSFVTAVAVHVSAGRLRVASAGHPPPVLLGAGAATVVAVEPGPPLALATGALPCPQVEVPLATGTAVLLHSDGLLDRAWGGGTRSTDVLALAAGVATVDLEAAADALLALADAAGPAVDDVSLLLARPAG